MEKKFTNVEFDMNNQVIWEEVNKKAEDLLECINECFMNGREKSLAITKLEESIMWLGKSLREETLKKDQTVE